MYVPPKPPKAVVPEANKQEVAARAGDLIETVLKPDTPHAPMPMTFIVRWPTLMRPHSLKGQVEHGAMLGGAVDGEHHLHGD